MPTHPDHFVDWRFVRKQALLNHLSDNDHAAREFDIFVIEIPAVTKRECICGEKTAIRTNNEQARCRFHAVINRLTFHFVRETFQANFAGLAFHQAIVMQRLLVTDVAPVPIFLSHVAARAHVRRIFRELKNVRAEKTDSMLD